MKKNGLLTFIFACIPGAGPMYYGYMKRGLSQITLVCVCLAMSSIIAALSILVPIIWMFSFFDTYDLIRHMVAGDAKPDGFMLLEDAGLGSISSILPNYHNLIGWAMIGLGAWAIYDGVISEALERLLYALGVENAWYILHSIPTLVVAVLLIWGGIKLLGGHHGNANQPYTPPAPDARENDAEIYPYHPTHPGPEDSADRQ
ncbi:MAG: hypothetical protein PHO10_05160 [Gemmiger sp.]|nr:hypothetical protein [Gemmiger sp.]